jgi:hypothetical protein
MSNLFRDTLESQKVIRVMSTFDIKQMPELSLKCTIIFIISYMYVFAS